MRLELCAFLRPSELPIMNEQDNGAVVALMRARTAWAYLGLLGPTWAYLGLLGHTAAAPLVSRLVKKKTNAHTHPARRAVADVEPPPLEVKVPKSTRQSCRAGRLHPALASE